MDPSGTSALVTGASSGIGRETALRLAAAGARLRLVARSADRLSAVAAEIGAAGGTAEALPLDLAETGAAQGALGPAAEADPPDIVVHCAGSGRWRPFLDTSPEEAAEMIAVPYLAAFAVTAAVLPAMLRRGSGRIVVLTSPASHIVWPGACGYIAARHALKGFATALGRELGGTGVGVSLVTLGTVDSPYWHHNPGSREHVPPAPRWLLPPLSTGEAADAIMAAIRGDRATLVRPRAYRLLFALGLDA